MGTVGRIARSVRAFTRELNRSQEQAGTKIPSIGLALGGGFARGVSHIGVLKVLEEAGLPIRFVAGTSVGAVIGAAYCSGVCAKELEELAALVRFRDFARWTISRFGLCSNDRMSGFLNSILKVKTFEELRIPLAVAATDFTTGDPVVFRSGPLIDPVRASCAYPGMFLPVQIDGRLLVDGLLGHAVPTVPLCEMGADRVIAVHLSAHWIDVSTPGPRHVFDVIGQCFSIAQLKMSALWKSKADLVLEPDVRGVGYDEFSRAAEIIHAGEEAARAAMPVIRSWLEPQPEPSEPKHRVRRAPVAATAPNPAK